MPEPPRTAAGHRVYHETHVVRLQFVLRGRELGFSIDELRVLLRLVDRGEQTCSEVIALTEGHLSDMRSRIADLRRIQKVLAATATQCFGKNAPECPVLETLASRLHRRVSGPACMLAAGRRHRPGSIFQTCRRSVGLWQSLVQDRVLSSCIGQPATDHVEPWLQTELVD